MGLLFLLPGGPLQAQALDADGPIKYAENGMGPVATYTAEDPEGTAITWSLDGTDAGVFDIDEGVLTFKESPNYEMATGGGANGTSNTYSVMVVATDSSGATAEKAVTVMVTNVEEAGMLTLSTLQPVDGIEVMTTLTDIDSVTSGNPTGTVTAEDIAWKWAKSLNRTGTYTDIDGETSAMYTPKPDDVNHYLRATATYMDGQGSDKTEMAMSAHKVLAPRSTNTPPVFEDSDGEEITEGITREVAENSAAGTDVGDPVEASDGEGDVLTYTLAGDDAASFDIDVATGQLRTKAALNKEERDTSYMVTVTATDPFAGTNNDTIPVTITVTNVDEAPEVTGMDSVRFAENTAVEDAVGTYTVTDDEDTNTDVPLTLSGADAADFNLIDDNNDGTYDLAFNQSPNYEAPADAGTDNVYNITVVATDSDNQTDMMAVTVMVTNEDEAGTLTLSTLQPRVGIPLTATLTDIDGAVSDVTWTWERDDAMGFDSPATIEGADSATYTPTDDDEGMYLRATATSYTDPQGSGHTEMPVLVVSDNMVEIDDTNKAPEFSDQDMETDGDQTDQERMVEENTEPGEVIGSEVTATDPNGDTLTYALGGTDMASFSIVRDSGQLQTKAALDKEEKDTYMVTVTAMDPSGLNATINVTIKVTNVDENPEVTGMDSVRVPENTAVSTAVETYMATDDEDDKAGTAIIWSLDGTDAGVFDIDEGVLTFKESPNYEMATGGGANGTSNTYSVTVVATDSNGATAEKPVTVMVTNVDEAGTLTLSTLQPVDGIEVMTTLTDIDSVTSGNPTGTVTAEDIPWKWAKSLNRVGTYTDIDGETSAMYTPKPDDVNHYLRATATYMDGQGSDKTEMAISARKVVTSRSTNTPPVFNDADGDEIPGGTNIAREVAENTPKGEAVEDPVAADDSEGDVLTYTLAGDDAASFDIDVATGQLRTKAALNKEERDTSYMVTVTATDPFAGTNNDTIPVTITVTNVDEAPEVTGMDSVRFAENTAVEDAVGTYTVTDDEDTNTDVPLTLSGADAADFNLIDDNNDGTYDLAFNQSPNYEAPADAGTDNVYNITVVATDSDNQTDMMAVTVMVTNEDEAGTLTLSTVQPRVGTPLTATLTDIDGAVSDVTWTWERDDAMGFDSPATIEGADSATYTPTDDDEGMYLRATATSYTDPQGSGHTEMPVLVVSDNMVEIDDTNKAPEFSDQDMETDGDQTDQERMVEENTEPGEVIGSEVTATDPNGDTLTYALGGTDMASFSIVRDSGQLQTKAALDKEEKDIYMVTVTATDPSGLSATVNVTIKVTNVDENPEIMRAPDANVAPEFASATTSRTVAEDMVAGGDVGNPVAANDANGDALTYALSGTDAASFDIDPDTGQLMTKVALDYETRATYSVTVTASDSGGLSDSIDVTITVINEDEMGRVTFWRDGADATTAVIMVGDMLGGLAEDPDGNVGDTPPITDMYPNITGATWQWAKTMTPDMMASWMDITGATDAAYTVMDADEGYHLRATAMYDDGEGMGKMASEETMMVMMMTMNAAPEFADSEDGARSVAENTVAGMDIGDPVTATDADDDTLAYTLGGTDAASFAIGSDTGQLMTKEALDYETKDSYIVMVTATDPHDLSVTITVTITVTNVDEMGRVTFWRDGADATTAAIMVGDMLSGLAEDPDGNVGDTPPITDMYPNITGATWQWAKTMTPDMMASWMDITGATDAAYTVMDADGGYHLRATAMYDDGEGMGKMASMQTMMVMMMTMNAAPEFADSEDGARSVAENTVAGMDIGDPVTATDADDDTLAYTLGGTDAASFAIGSDTGQLMTLASLDYETKATYSVTVTASDSGGLSDSIDVTITVTDVDEMQPAVFDPLAKYDANNSGELEKDEVIKAINDYLFGVGADAISKEDVIETINLYLFS